MGRQARPCGGRRQGVAAGSVLPSGRPPTHNPPPSVNPPPPLSLRRIAQLWWPLAASWILMGIELPLFTACVARMADPKVTLAAYGSLVFPLALVIEAPIIMLLAAATALASDRDSWAKLLRFMHSTSAVLTVLHVAVAFTPLFDLLAVRVFEVPPEVVEPARIGLRIMTPWTWSIAYRRTHQGVLIRFERGRPILIGTCLRLAANLTVYALGFLAVALEHPFPGSVVGPCAVAVGVSSEALFIGWCTRRVLAERGLPDRPDGELLTRAHFLRFYVPLALTPLIALITQPIGSAAMARMHDPLNSLAAWPAVHGLIFLVRSAGFAYNEVVLSLLGTSGARPALRRFGILLGTVSSGLLALIAATRLAPLWFSGVVDLPPELSSLATLALGWGFLWPASQAMQSWFQGQLVHQRRTRCVTEAMGVYFLVVVPLLIAGTRWSPWPGVQFVVLAFTLGNLVQTGWLAWRSRG